MAGSMKRLSPGDDAPFGVVTDGWLRLVWLAGQVEPYRVDLEDGTPLCNTRYW
jgi:hypothetical protein